jgi:hypothetical protein
MTDKPSSATPPAGSGDNLPPLPRRRLTARGWAYLLGFVALPFLALCLGLDYVLYLSARAGFGPCLSLFCLMLE